MRLPIDTGAISFLCAKAPEQVLDFETKAARTDASGQVLYGVALLAMAEGEAEVIQVKVPGEPKALTPGLSVRPVGLVAQPWAMGERSGVAYRAIRLEQVREPARTAS
jgi:hypothetical protein